MNCVNPGGERREGFAKWRFGSAPAFTASDGPLNRLQSRALFSLSLIFTTVLFHSAPAFTAFTASDVYQTPYFHSVFCCYQTLVWSIIFTQPIPSQFDKHYQTSSLINDFTPSFHVFLVKDNYALIWLIPTSIEQTLRNCCGLKRKQQVFYNSFLCRLFRRRGLGGTQLLQWYLRPGFIGSSLETPPIHLRLSLS